MSFLDKFLNRNAAAQQPVAPEPQPKPTQETAQQTPVQNLPDNVKAQAMEAGKPTAEVLIEKATTPVNTAPKSTPNTPSRGRHPGISR